LSAFTLDDLLTSFPPPIVDTVDRLRQIIHQVAPGAKEKANRGWCSISYRDAQVGYFCGIFLFESHVDLIFEFGSLLEDPQGSLQGKAKQTRYLRFHEPGDVDKETVSFFIQSALDLPSSHSARRGMTGDKHKSTTKES